MNPVRDFRVGYHGSISLLFPMTPAAKVWVLENLPADHQTFGKAIVVEARYLDPILDGIVSDGLSVA